MSFVNRLKCCLAAALLLSAAVLRGAPPTPEELRTSFAAATREKYPNADTVTLYDGETVVYQADGLSESTNVTCVRALTEAGRKELRKLSFNFKAQYGAYSIPHAEIIKPDGKRIAVDLAKNVSVAISTRSMGSNIYSDQDKVLTLTVPQLEIGDAILLTLKYKASKTPFPGIFSDIFLLQGRDPVIFAEVTVNAPEALPLRSVAVKSPVAGTVKYLGEKRADGRIVYRWTAENVPQVIPEPDMPPISSVSQRLLVSTARDWQEISRWYYQLCRPRLDAVDDEIKAEVKKLVSGKKTDRDKAMALFQFVSQKIRYTGVDGEDRAPGFEPHDVRDTFRQRHGVCRDKAGLLVAMLELAGFKAYPVLFHAGKSAVDDEVPASRFNHAVVAWETAPGKYQLMDPTCETTQDFFPGYLANQSYLVARPEGDTLRRSPSPPAEENALVITTVASFDTRGALRGRSTLEFSGYNDLLYRGEFSKRRELIRQVFCRQVKLAIPGAKITRFRLSPEDVRDMSRPLKLEIAYFAPDALAAAPYAAPLRMPELADRFGIIAYMIDDISLDSRRHPQLFHTTSVTREKITLTLPDPVRLLSLPPGSDLTAPGASWTRKFTADGNVVHSESALRIDRLEVAPEQYAELRELRRRRLTDSAVLPLISMRFSELPPDKLATAFPTADSFLEDEKYSVDLKVGNCRIERIRKRRILTYAGVKKFSQLKITYDPRYQDVQISASVTSPDGRRTALAPKHVIDMDASWVADAPRYPKARTRVAVLPSVQIGSLVETKVVFSTKDTWFFDLAVPLFTHAPAARRELVINVVGSKRFHHSPPPAGGDFHTGKQGNSRTSTLVMTDLPAIPEEISQPDVEVFAPTMYLSNGDYTIYAERLNRKLSELAAAPSPEADRLYAGIDRAEKEIDKATKIRDIVARKIRRAGPALNRIRLDDITAPEVTIRDGYGNSADSAVVIAALLNRAGIAYEFVAASRLPYLLCNTQPLRRYPRQVFDEVLVRIPKLDMYLNDTDQYAAPGSTPHASMIGLELKSGRLTAIRPGYKSEDAVTTRFEIRVAENGSAEIDVVREYSGTLFNRRKRRYFEMTPEERRIFCETVAAKLLPEAKLKTAKCDFDRYPGRIEMNFKAEKFAVPFGGKLMFDLPGYEEMVRAVNAVDSDRKTPALRKQGIRMTLKYLITVPRGCTPERRRQALVNLGRRSSGYFTENSDSMLDRIYIDALLVLPSEIIQPCDYVELVNLQHELNRHFLRRIVVSKEKKRRM